MMAECIEGVAIMDDRWIHVLPPPFRHGDLFKGWNRRSPFGRHGKARQGFWTTERRFVDRHEAWKIAEAAGQIFRRVGGDTIKGGKLFSENLW